MTAATALDRGRDAYGRWSWQDARVQLAIADRQAPVEPEDLERLAIAAHMAGNDAESFDAMTRAHHEYLQQNDVPRAARMAFWLGMNFMDRGEMAQAGGWLARARTLAESVPPCVEQGYVLLPVALQALESGDPATALATMEQVAEIAASFKDGELTALSHLGRGLALMHLGRTAEGISHHDEAMVAVTAGEVSPLVAGIIYCAVIEACQEIADLRRAQEWTAALTRWCASQPDLVPYRGQCMVYRSEVLQLHGEWQDALDEARLASERLSDLPAAGVAHYRRAELHRLRGEFVEAEAAYKQASEWGRRLEPGLALLRLAEGRVDAANAAIRRALDEAQDPVSRTKLLPAFVEITLAAGDVPAASTAVEEFVALAAERDVAFLHAQATEARGAVLLAEGAAGAALPVLRDGWAAWQDLKAPYEAARLRVLIGMACRALGDEDSATMEFAAGRQAFKQLGAASELTRLEIIVARPTGHSASGLSPRELEVLKLIAAGKSNRAIADELVISEKTVARHVSNIFTKLEVSSRSAATAYAYENSLA